MIKKVLVAALKYGAPLFLVALPAVAIYGEISPWEKSEEVLAKYSEGATILIGLRYQSGNKGGKLYSTQSRTYINIEGIPPKSKTIVVSVSADGRTEINERDGGLVTLVATYLFLMFVTWWFWFGPEKNTHNKSSESDAGKLSGASR